MLPRYFYHTTPVKNLNSIINDEMVEIAISQNKSGHLKLHIPEGTLLMGENAILRLWINEPQAAGVFQLKAEQQIPITKGGTPPEINVTAFTPEELVTEILTSGCVEALNIQYTGNLNSIAYFSSGIPGLDFEEGIILCSGNADEMAGPNDNTNQSGNMNAPGDNDLNNVIGGQTRDASVLEFDFIFKRYRLIVFCRLYL